MAFVFGMADFRNGGVGDCETGRDSTADRSYVTIPKVRHSSLDTYSKWHVVEKIPFTT